MAAYWLLGENCHDVVDSDGDGDGDESDQVAFFEDIVLSDHLSSSTDRVTKFSLLIGYLYFKFAFMSHSVMLMNILSFVNEVF